MPAEYLRHQAAVCQRLSRTCFDLQVAAQLREIAEEFRAKAAELDRIPLAPDATCGDAHMRLARGDTAD